MTGGPLYAENNQIRYDPFQRDIDTACYSLFKRSSSLSDLLIYDPAESGRDHKNVGTGQEQLK